MNNASDNRIRPSFLDFRQWHVGLLGIILLALGVVGIAVRIMGAEFPLRVVHLISDEAFQLPGRAGAFVYATKPEMIFAEPRAICSRPLYGVFGKRAFRLDKINKTNMLYDQLIMDLNMNGDLNDDPACFNNSHPHSARRGELTFGPVILSTNLSAGMWQPSYFASVALYDRIRSIAKFNSRDSFRGLLIMKSASYLEAKIQLSGPNQTIGLWDGNCNLHFGDRHKFESLHKLNPMNQDYEPVDYLLQDLDFQDSFGRGLMKMKVEFLGSLVPHERQLSSQPITIPLKS